MRWLIFIALMVAGCREERMAEERAGVERCQKLCREIGSPEWSYKVTGVYGGCWCSGPVPELPVCPTHRPDGGLCQ